MNDAVAPLQSARPIVESVWIILDKIDRRKERFGKDRPRLGFIARESDDAVSFILQ
jgi:hypothetical protein